MQTPLPDDVRRLLWDLDASTADLPASRPLLFERVMTRGSLEGMRWLLAAFARDELRAFVLGPRGNSMPPRELAFWSTILDLELPPRARLPGGGRPAWAG